MGSAEIVCPPMRVRQLWTCACLSAAAAEGKIRAIRLHAVRGRSQNGKKLGKHGRTADVGNADAAALARQRAGDKDDLPVHPRDAGAVDGGGLNGYLQRIAAV